MPTKLLYVEDDSDLAWIALDFIGIKFPDIELTMTTTVREALEALECQQFDVIICDYNLPDGKGGRVYQQVQGLSVKPRFALCSSVPVGAETPELIGSGIEELDKSRLHVSLSNFLNGLVGAK